MNHLLDVDDLGADELRHIIELGLAPLNTLGKPLQGQGVACVFEKPSTRTRNSTEMAVFQLGGHPVYITGQEIGVDVRESAEDVTRTLACYHRAIFARVFEHDQLVRMASVDAVPVVNLLSDRAHPLQAIADVITIAEEFGTVEGRTVCYVGDTNNVAISLGLAVTLLGGDFRLASPSGYEISEEDQQRFQSFDPDMNMFDNPTEAVSGADVVYTDTWVSMGQEEEKKKRLADFAGFMVDETLMSAAEDAIFMHCLPAHRGEEVSDGVLDGSQSRIWEQAAHRQTAARGVLAWLTSADPKGA